MENNSFPQSLSELMKWPNVLILGEGHSLRSEAKSFFFQMHNFIGEFEIEHLWIEEGKHIYCAMPLNPVAANADQIPPIFLVK